MELQCLQETLKKGLSLANRAVATRSTLPVLSNVLLETDDGQLRISATNLELGIRTWIGAKVQSEGAVTLPAKLLNDVVNALPNQVVSLSLDDRTQTVNIKCGKFETNIKGITADEFPILPTSQESPLLELPPDVLRTAIDQVAYAAAQTDSKPIQQGVSWRARGNSLRLVALDGFRLALKNIPVNTSDVDIIIPSQSLMELSRILATLEGNAEMTITPNQGLAIFRTESVELSTRLIDGQYPDVDMYLQQFKEWSTRIVVETSEINTAVKMASLFVAESSSKAIKLWCGGHEHENGTLVITGVANETGNNKTELDCVFAGHSNQIALNYRYLSDAINACKTQQIAIQMQEANKPALITPIGDDSYMALVFSVNVVT